MTRLLTERTGRMDAAPNDAGLTAPRRAGRAAGGPLFCEPSWCWSSFGEVGWWVLPQWQAPLLGDLGLRLDEWRREGRLATVKTGPQRVVYRADLPEGSVFVKHFLVPGWREVLRQWFRRGKGRNEARRALHLAAIGVETITPIALGEQRRRRFLFENYLVTPAIADTVPLDEFVECRLDELPAERRGKVRRELAVAVAELTARIHRAGFVHQDFHPGNLLVRFDAEGRPRLAMIDLDALRVRRRLRWRDARDNLALLNHYFWVRCGRSDRHRFLRAYLDALGREPTDVRRFARSIESATRAWAERLWRRWGRRCRGTNKYFHQADGLDTWGVAARELDPDVLRALLDDPDAPFADPASVVLKHSRTTTVAEATLPVDGQPTRVIYKRFNRKKWLDPLLTIFRPSRGWRAWQAAQHLACRAVPTPANLAFIARRRPGQRLLPWHHWPHDTYLVTRKAEPSITLADHARAVLPTLAPEVQRLQRRRLGRSLARLIRTLHERSLSHRDLKAANILIEGEPWGDEPRLSLIDLVGVELRHPLPWDRRVQNLARLHLSLADVPGRTRTDTLRFLRSYLPWSHTPRAEWKALWRAVERRGRVKVARNRRRGRPLS